MSWTQQKRHWTLNLEVFNLGSLLKATGSRSIEALIDLSQNGGCPNVCPTPSSLIFLQKAALCLCFHDFYGRTWFIEPDQCRPRLPAKVPMDPRTFKEMRFIFSVKLCGQRGPSLISFGPCKTPTSASRDPETQRLVVGGNSVPSIAIRGGRHAFKMLGLRAATIS